MIWLFWTAAGLMAALAAGLVVGRAGAAARGAAAGGEDPTLPVYRRQLAEIDDLAARGLLGESETGAAHAEAARRLLAAAERGDPAETAGGRPARLMVLVGLGAALLAALGLYAALGSPGFPDQPYRARLAHWRADPAKLRAPEMAAVLRLMAAQHPKDPQALEYLGRAELASEDPIAAITALRKAAALAPGRAETQLLLGEALTAAAEGARSPDAEAAFRQAIALDPANLPARYLLARAQIMGGDRAAGEAGWKAIQAILPAGDPRRAAMDQDMAQLTGAAALKGVDAAAANAAATGAAPAGAEQADFIRGMVARLAERLKTMPDDPAGWARLVRAYKVLGDTAAKTAALETARKQFAGRPDALAVVEAEAR